MRWGLGLVAVAGCGRIGFAPQADASSVAEDAGLPAGLVAWFPLDEADAPFDDVLGGLPGTCSGAQCPSAIPGLHGGARQFDGDDDCITVAAQPQLEPPELTLAVWVNQAASANMSPLAMRAGSGTTNAWQLETDYADTNPLAMTFTTYNGASNDQTTTATDEIVLGTWQHIAATWDHDGKRIYIDGVMRASDGVSGPAMYTSLPLKIGCDDNGGLDVLHYEGSIDDVQIYNRALTGAEIAGLATR